VRGVWLSLYLGIFNLLPVPPLDGSKLLLAARIPCHLHGDLALRLHAADRGRFGLRLRPLDGPVELLGRAGDPRGLAIAPAREVIEKGDLCCSRNVTTMRLRSRLQRRIAMSTADTYVRARIDSATKERAADLWQQWASISDAIRLLMLRIVDEPVTLRGQGAKRDHPQGDCRA